MIYKNSINSLLILLREDLLIELRKLCEQKGNLETGGILIGIYDLELKSAIVTKVIGPPADSKHGRFTFIRGTRGVKENLEEFWKEGEYYLGEWHFHPNALPTASSQDVNQMKKIAKNQIYKCPEPLMLIIGQDGEDFIESFYISIKGADLIRFYKES
jgi:integrative and conjugative element protein (TIGR02256 family)